MENDDVIFYFNWVLLFFVVMDFILYFVLRDFAPVPSEQNVFVEPQLDYSLLSSLSIVIPCALASIWGICFILFYSV